ncbi:MAG: N-formylglutamate deformylase [Pseudomonadota bacterium]
MKFLDIIQGESPVILGLPHTGTEVPQDVMANLNATGQALADTDWHIHDLYADLAPDVTCVRTRVHRYVVDVNRDPSGQSLYPGQNTTTLCPLTDFEGVPIYREGAAPDATEVAQRRDTYHGPYHQALAAEIARIKAQHGFAILYDCHSIRSEIPFLFEGQLPDFSIGTNDGATCASLIQGIVLRHCEAAKGYSCVLNGRFKGGWTTRHYGQPAEGVHAIQMELAQSTYMVEAPPWTYDPPRAEETRAHLAAILASLQAMKKEDLA